MTTDPELVPVAQGIERLIPVVRGSHDEFAGLQPDPEGAYVRYADHASIVAELQKVAMVIQNERIARQTAAASLSECRAELAALRARVEALGVSWRQASVRYGELHERLPSMGYDASRATVESCIRELMGLLAAPAGGEG